VPRTDTYCPIRAPLSFPFELRTVLHLLAESLAEIVPDSPAQLPLYGLLPLLQLAIPAAGTDKMRCATSGASIIVAAIPPTKCRSIWQWNNQTPITKSVFSSTQLSQKLTWIISFEADYDVAIGSDHCHVALRRCTGQGAFVTIP
jgi:hypothetical protein